MEKALQASMVTLEAGKPDCCTAGGQVGGGAEQQGGRGARGWAGLMPPPPHPCFGCSIILRQGICLGWGGGTCPGWEVGLGGSCWRGTMIRWSQEVPGVLH